MLDRRWLTHVVATFIKSLTLSSLAGAALAATVYRPSSSPPSAAAKATHAAHADGLMMRAVGRVAYAASVPTRDISADMVSIARQDFIMGCDRSTDVDCHFDESPARHVMVERFRIDRREVTVAEFRACVDAGVCPEASFYEHRQQPGCNFGQRDAHPMNCVSWRGAQAYCGFVKKRLPYEREWEIAARGDDRRAFPWGDEVASCRLAWVKNEQAGCGGRSTAPVGSHPLDRSPFGVLGMAGNVAEWTGSWYQKRRLRAVRGGSWRSPPAGAQVFRRSGGVPSAKMVDVGFRCAAGLSQR